MFSVLLQCTQWQCTGYAEGLICALQACTTFVKISVWFYFAFFNVDKKKLFVTLLWVLKSKIYQLYKYQKNLYLLKHC